MNTAIAPAPVVAAQRIYLNARLSDYFGVAYQNKGQRTMLHTAALDRAFDEWDEDHQAIIDRGGELELEGDGYGWWNVIG